jgi:hypothetical protein
MIRSPGTDGFSARVKGVMLSASGSVNIKIAQSTKIDLLTSSGL